MENLCNIASGNVMQKKLQVGSCFSVVSDSATGYI